MRHEMPHEMRHEFFNDALGPARVAQRRPGRTDPELE